MASSVLPGVGVALAAQSAVALPAIITVKGLKAKAGPAYKWSFNSKVTTPFTGTLYPGQNRTAKVTLDIERTSVDRGYILTGKFIITNPLQNQQLLEITGLKAVFGPLPKPVAQALDCPGAVLEAGQSLPCSFRFDLPNDKLTTMTPVVLVKGMPQLQGESMKLQWPTEADEDRDMLPHGKASEDNDCALIQLGVAAGGLEQVVRISTDEEDADILKAGMEVCEDDVSLEYNITVVSPAAAAAAPAAPAAAAAEVVVVLVFSKGMNCVHSLWTKSAWRLPYQHA
jgi:hypothetical protein